MPEAAPEPYATGLLETGDGNRIYWETVGNPDGVPVLIVHGGPGYGCTVRMRRPFDLQRHRVILFDQRNCGRSLPHASDPSADISRNTTQHLLHDMEQLRGHLGVEKWMLFGGSWGSALALAYAEAHPDRVSAVLLVSVMTARKRELDWLYRVRARSSRRRGRSSGTPPESARGFGRRAKASRLSSTCWPATAR